MTAVWILLVIFTFIIIVSTVDEKEKTKRQKMKLMAMLREEEMAKGYNPGTYSNFSDEDEKAFDAKASTSHMSREDLKEGIKDLDERLKNLDTILKNRKNKDWKKDVN